MTKFCAPAVEQSVFGQPPSTINKIQQVFSQFSTIERVRLYGSRAKGNFRNGSDIDLTIMENHLNPEQLTTIELALDDLMTPYTFDLSIFAEIQNTKLVEHIRSLGIDFYVKKTN